jgi:hypothetical protein
MSLLFPCPCVDIPVWFGLLAADRSMLSMVIFFFFFFFFFSPSTTETETTKKCYFSSFWGFGFLVGLYISFFYVSVRLFVYIYISLYLLVLLSSISFVALVFSSPFCFVPFLLLVCVVWVIKTNWEIYRRRRRSVVLYGRQPTSRFGFSFVFLRDVYGSESSIDTLYI